MDKFTVMTGAVMLPNPEEFPNRIGELNKIDSIGKVHELYGSGRTSKFNLPTARPDFRLVDIDWEYLEKYIKACHDNGLIFNYTMNANFIGGLEDIYFKYDKIVEALHHLEEIKVDRITVSHPVLMDMICNHTNLPIEVSTILNVNSIQAPTELKRRYPNINKICMSIDKIRCLDFVRKLNKECEKNDILLECMVSEFCAIGYMSCSQLHRNFCYNLHSLNQPQDIAQKKQWTDKDGFVYNMPKEIAGYPWNSGKTGCIFNRAINPKIWLSSRTIWPNEIKEYLEFTGVKQIKVTTRTAPVDFALELTKRYMIGKYDGPLAGLWLALQASTLDKRKLFEQIQKNASTSVPYMCSELSEKRYISAVLGGIKYTGHYSFMSIFFLNPEFDFSNVKWVDKENDEAFESYESNWLYVWDKLLNSK